MATSNYYLNQMADIKLKINNAKERIKKCEKLANAINRLRDLDEIEYTLEDAEDFLREGFVSNYQIFAEKEITDCKKNITTIYKKVDSTNKEINSHIENENSLIESLNVQYQFAQQNYHLCLKKEAGE